MTTCTFVVGCGCDTDQGVVVTVTATGCADSDNTGMIGSLCVYCFPGFCVASGAVTTCAEILADRSTDQATVYIVTAGATVVSIGGRTGQGIVVAEAATGRCYLNQAGVVRGVEGVDTLPGCVWIRSGDMAGDTIATSGRNPCFQVRDRIVTEQTLIRMDNGNRGIV